MARVPGRHRSTHGRWDAGRSGSSRPTRDASSAASRSADPAASSCAISPTKYGPWDKNPNLCRRCVIGLGSAEVMGAEVDVSFLFADVRRSSDLASAIGTLEFTHLMQRFYSVATEVLFDHEALLDKFVGDEVVGFFLPFMAGDEHPRVAVEAARALVRGRRATARTEGPWIPLGAGVHTGPSFVGYISRGEASEFTALGDTINVDGPPRRAGEGRRDPDHGGGGGVARDRRSRATPPLAERPRAGRARDHDRRARTGRGRRGVGDRSSATSPRRSRTPRSSLHPGGPGSPSPSSVASSSESAEMTE